METNTKERIKDLYMNQDVIKQRLGIYNRVHNTKIQEIAWLEELITKDNQNLTAIKEEIQTLSHTKGGPKE